MSELLDIARNAIAVCICHGDNDNPNVEIPLSLVSELIAEVERLEAGLAEERESHMETAAILRRARNRLGDVDE